MRFSFFKNLEAYREKAKAEIERTTDNVERVTDGENVAADFDLNQLQAAVEFDAQRAAKERHTDVAAQIAVYELQVKKQRVMEELKNSLANIDDPEYQWNRDPKEKLVQWENGQFSYFAKGGVAESLSKGELMTDGEWGIRYFLDPECVPRGVRKEFFVERAKGELRALLDRQIVTDESNSATTDMAKQRAYGEIGKRLDVESEQTGVIAEKMARTFLSKLAIDHGFDFDVVPADAYQDVEQKMDFIVHRKPSRQKEGGALQGVEIEEGSHDVGVQFTVNRDRQIIEHKGYQVAKANGRLGARENAGNGRNVVESVVLVSVSGRELRAAYDQWKEKKRPGGPERFLAETTRKELFDAALADVYSAEERAAMWNAVNGRK